MVLRRLIVVALVLLTALSGCGGSDEETPAAGMTLPGGGEVEFPGFGPAGEWPSGIPDEIPVLDGEITNVMSGQSHTRLFYQGVSDSDVLDYVRGLESNGWELEFVVYESPTDTGQAEERAAAGEWDLVRAKKGEYGLRLEFGGGTGVLDIEGLSGDVVGVDTSWPTEWADFPAPSQLAVDQVIYLGENGPMVDFTYESDDDILAYSDELEAVGFTVINRSFNQNDELISIVLRGDQHEVTLRAYPANRLSVTSIDPEDSWLSPPPAAGGSDDEDPGFSVVTKEFPDWLPEVPGGDVSFATEDPNGGFTASVLIGEGHSVAEYVQVLNDAGYLAADTMLMGYVLSDGERTITIFGDDNGFSPLSILIQVAGE